MDSQTNEASATSSQWKPAQTYTMAAVCLLVGLVIGYFLRGSARQPAMTVATEAVPQMGQAPAAQNPPTGGQQQKPSLDQMKQMGDKQAAPLLAQLKKDPKNADVLNQLGTMYRLTHQFKTAIDYYQKFLDASAGKAPDEEWQAKQRLQILKK